MPSSGTEMIAASTGIVAIAGAGYGGRRPAIGRALHRTQERLEPADRPHGQILDRNDPGTARQAA